MIIVIHALFGKRKQKLHLIFFFHSTKHTTFPKDVDSFSHSNNLSPKCSSFGWSEGP